MTTEQLDSLKEPINNLLIAGRELSGKDLLIRVKQRFVDLVYIDYIREYIYARVELATGDIYSDFGKKPRGNVFVAPWYGLDVIDAYGVIVNSKKYSQRVAQLEATKLIIPAASTTQ